VYNSPWPESIMPSKGASLPVKFGPSDIAWLQ